MPDSKKLTFKPLAGGRFRCNQTGKIVTQRRVKAYRRQTLGGHKSPPPLPPLPTRRQIVVRRGFFLGW